MPKVAIIMGSESDMETVKPAVDALNMLGIDHEVKIMSAHRKPEKVREFGLSARENGIEVIIAAAGAAAHLPGVIASWTTIPVIGVPIASSELRGLDALYSIVQMPGGIPVAAVAIGSAGARNAAFLAAEILGLKYENIREAYDEYRKELSRDKGEAGQ